MNYQELIQLQVQLNYGWEPIPLDGTFFTTDAIEKYKSGNLPSTVPLVTGTNSYEGSLVQAAFLGGLNDLRYEQKGDTRI